VEWDQLCAELALELCQGSCPGTGDCFQPNGTPGCEDEECCKEVCFEDIFCCAVQWDEACAAEAFIICTCGGKGSCAVPHGLLGCSDEKCCRAVCEIDPFCCQVAWDGICVSEAAQLCGVTTKGCGDKGTGSCFEPNGTPFCDDALCCTIVCGFDPLCCEVMWDSICVNLANLCNPNQLACPGDIDHSGAVDVTDLITAMMDIGCAAPARCLGDANHDGACDVQDMMLVLKTWGQCP
jgi:hypothetical protein